MEMSGLNPESDMILEVAIIVTDTNLNTVAEAPVLVVHQPDMVLTGMDEWNQAIHGNSGLIDWVKDSPLGNAEVESRLVDFLMQYVRRKRPLCAATRFARTDA
jgi:oligoribonuclease